MRPSALHPSEPAHPRHLYTAADVALVAACPIWGGHSAFAREWSGGVSLAECLGSTVYAGAVSLPSTDNCCLLHCALNVARQSIWSDQRSQISSIYLPCRVQPQEGVSLCCRGARRLLVWMQCQQCFLVGCPDVCWRCICWDTQDAIESLSPCHTAGHASSLMGLQHVCTGCHEYCIANVQNR